MNNAPYIRHFVFFSAKDKADVGKIAEGLSMLSEIPHAATLEVRENLLRDEWSNEIDVVVYGEFESDEALAAFKAHPIYQKCIDVVRPLRELRFVADMKP